MASGRWRVAGATITLARRVAPPAAPLRGHDRMALVECGRVAGSGMPFFRVPRALCAPSPSPGALRPRPRHLGDMIEWHWLNVEEWHDLACHSFVSPAPFVHHHPHPSPYAKASEDRAPSKALCA